VDRLFSPHTFADFGPCALTLSAEPPTVCQIQGRGLAQLRLQVREGCSGRPGVYGMLNRHGELIYVGKAKSLRARLLSYFRPRSRDPKAGRIITQAAAIVWEYNSSEFAALHRELELIRRWRPRLNVQGQPNGRRHTFVCLGRQPAPYAFLARTPPRDVQAIFGPVRAGEPAREAVRRLNDSCGLRDCSQAQEMVFADQRELFPVLRSAGCLRYEIGTCLGPCTAACTRQAYADRVRAAHAFLAGTDLGPLRQLERDLAAAAAAQAYEKAAGLRDRVAALQWLFEQLDQLRHIRAAGSFVYPVAGHDGTQVWYLIHHGRAIAAVAAPHSDAARRAVADQVERVFGAEDMRGRLESAEHLEGVLLVASWFRRYPEERARTWGPQEVLAQCGRAPQPGSLLPHRNGAVRSR
jgi:excinuclease ABC subunit C